jgi:hypothetical protein
MTSCTTGASYLGTISTGPSSSISSGAAAEAQEQGCGGISSVVGILIFLFILGIFSHAVKSSLPGNLHDELIPRLNHSFKGGLLFFQPMSVHPQLLAQGLQLRDLLAWLLLMLSQQLDLLDSFI